MIPWGVASTLGNLGVLAFAAGDAATGTSFVIEAVAAAVEEIVHVGEGVLDGDHGAAALGVDDGHLGAIRCVERAPAMAGHSSVVQRPQDARFGLDELQHVALVEGVVARVLPEAPARI